MKTFQTFCEVVFLLSGLFLLLNHCYHGISSVIYGEDYSASNDLIIAFIFLGFFQTQGMIKREIQKLKDEL